MTWVQWHCFKAWHQTLRQTLRLKYGLAHCKGAFPGALICFSSSDWSLACCWPRFTNIPPNSFQAQFGKQHGQGPFPVGSLDIATLFWKAREFNEWMQAFLCQLASRLKRCPGPVWFSQTDIALGLLLISAIDFLGSEGLAVYLWKRLCENGACMKEWFQRLFIMNMVLFNLTSHSQTDLGFLGLI